jgi:hypothetical protein
MVVSVFVGGSRFDLRRWRFENRVGNVNKANLKCQM